MIICKFGGTSVKNADAFQKVFNIIHNEIVNNEGKIHDCKIIVVLSASYGVTNRLYQLADFLSSGNYDDAYYCSMEITELYSTILRDLTFDKSGSVELSVEFDKLISEFLTLVDGIKLLGELTTRQKAKLISFGELFSSKILQIYCDFESLDNNFIHATELIKTDSNFLSAQVDSNYASQLINRINSADTNLIITQGFIGSDENGLTTLLGRGGSDYSASLIGAAVDAHEIRIYTDVCGIMSADPNLVPNASTISSMSSEEVEELAFLGAKVIHPDTIKPALNKNIPVKVLNTFLPNGDSTLISTIRKSDKYSLNIIRNSYLFVFSNIDNENEVLNDISRQVLKKVIFDFHSNSHRIICFRDNDLLDKDIWIDLTNQFNPFVQKVECISITNNEVISNFQSKIKLISMLSKLLGKIIIDIYTLRNSILIVFDNNLVDNLGEESIEEYLLQTHRILNEE